MIKNIIKEISFKRLFLFASLSLMVGCSGVEEDFESSFEGQTPSQSQVVGIADVQIRGTITPLASATKSRSDAQTEFVEGFVAGDVISVVLTREDGLASNYFYSLSDDMIWKLQGSDLLLLDDFNAAEKVSAHFIPGVTSLSDYNWCSQANPWTGEGLYPDILIDKSVELDSDKKLKIDFDHAYNGKLVVNLATLDRTRQSELDNAKLEMLSSIGLTYYQIKDGVVSYGQDFMPPRSLYKLDVAGKSQFQMLLCDISSYNMVFKITLGEDVYYSTIYRVDIEDSKYSRIDITVDLK